MDDWNLPNSAGYAAKTPQKITKIYGFCLIQLNNCADDSDEQTVLTRITTENEQRNS